MEKVKLEKKEVISISLNITTYATSRRYNAKCYYWVTYEDGSYSWGDFNERAGGYGYDKHSTVISNCLNAFKDAIDKNIDDNKPYGLYEDKSISYGIGVSAVLKCAEYLGYNIKSQYEGQREQNYRLEYVKEVK